MFLCLIGRRQLYRDQATKSSLFKLLSLAVISFSTLISISRILALSYYYHAPLELFYRLETEELPRVLNASGLLPPPPEPIPGHERAFEKYGYKVDLSPLKELNVTLCLGKEWHRFPSHWLVPDGVNVRFIKSEFDGHLPGHFLESKGEPWWTRQGTKVIPETLNDLNQEEPKHYVSEGVFFRGD
jgi:alpha-1,2-mannosyltransferase